MSQWHLLAMRSVSLSQTHLRTVSFFILTFLTYETKTEGLSVSFSKDRQVSMAQGKARTLKGNVMKMCSDIFLFSPRKRDVWTVTGPDTSDNWSMEWPSQRWESQTEYSILICHNSPLYQSEINVGSGARVP